MGASQWCKSNRIKIVIVILNISLYLVKADIVKLFVKITLEVVEEEIYDRICA